MFLAKTKVEATHDIFGESFNAFVVAVLPGIGDARNIITCLRY